MLWLLAILTARFARDCKYLVRSSDVLYPFRLMVERAIHPIQLVVDRQAILALNTKE
jgi:hypothetical protein